MHTSTVPAVAITSMWNAYFITMSIRFMGAWSIGGGERQLFRSLYLRSESLGLSVRCDVIEEVNGSVYPVEYKRGQQAGWENNHLQLCVQGLALEEQIDREVAFGYLFYYGSFRREKVMVDNLVIKIANQGVIKPKDFHDEMGEPRLKEHARKRFLEEFDRRRKDEVFHQLLRRKMSYREVFHKQAILLAKLIKGEMDDYYPFLVK